METKCWFLFVLIIFLVLFCVSGQRSFAETKFDLNPNLPVEDSIAVLPSIDSTPNTDAKPMPIVDTKPMPIIDTKPMPIVDTKPTQIMGDKKPIHGRHRKKKFRTTKPPAGFVPSNPVPGSPTQPLYRTSNTHKESLPLSGPLSPQVPSTGNFDSSFRPVVFSPSTLTIPPPSVTPFSPVVEGVTQAVHSVEVIRDNSFKDRTELWFSDNYDLSKCHTNVDYISEQFKQKFPRNLLKHGKETVLADLLATRLKECVKKQSGNEWERTEILITRLDVPVSEKDECRSGLIQEQISCLNVQSYACQFIERDFHFRLVPARLIVQEARLAEDGAEKCKRIAKMIKKQLEDRGTH